MFALVKLVRIVFDYSQPNDGIVDNLIEYLKFERRKMADQGTFFLKEEYFKVNLFAL